MGSVDKFTGVVSSVESSDWPSMLEKSDDSDCEVPAILNWELGKAFGLLNRL
jgi:hypothetical protein